MLCRSLQYKLDYSEEQREYGGRCVLVLKGIVVYFVVAYWTQEAALLI